MAIELTPPAVDRVASLLDKNPNKSWLRIAIQGGGCSGFSYVMDLVEGPEEGDKTFEFGDTVHVCVDRKSYLFLNGTEIDFEDTLLKSGFVYKNPVATGTCSCGTSFSV